MPTISTPPPPADPGQSASRNAELQLALFLALLILFSLCGIAGIALIVQEWGSLWRNALLLAVAALVLIVIVWLWRRRAWLVVALSLTVVFLLGRWGWSQHARLLVLQTENRMLRCALSHEEGCPSPIPPPPPPPPPPPTCKLSAEDLSALSAQCKAGAGDAVRPLVDQQALLNTKLDALHNDSETLKQAMASVQRELPKTAKSTDLAPITKDVSGAAKGIDVLLKNQYYQGQTLTEIKGECRSR